MPAYGHPNFPFVLEGAVGGTGRRGLDLSVHAHLAVGRGAENAAKLGKPGA